VLIPGAVALLVFLVFTYLFEQNRHNYFRAWQLAWAAYTLHYALKAVEYYQGPSPYCFCELAAAGGNGDLHLRLDPADEGVVSPEVVMTLR